MFVGVPLLLAVFAWGAGSAATWYVDDSVIESGDGTAWESAFQKIQEGVDAALDEDTVIVGEGTYLENVRLDGKNIVLTSIDPSDPSIVEGTVIEGGERGSVITFSGAEHAGCTVCGFTIRTGRATNGAGICGGTQEYRSEATIRNNVIAENVADDSGGGLAFCDGTIRDNVISKNSANQGGGVSDGFGTVEGNSISDNTAQHTGGGLYRCHGDVRENTLSGNWAGYGGGGMDDCDGWIYDNTITGNSSDSWGGGLRACDGTIRNNTITGNSAAGGGGVDNCQGTIEDNTISGNIAGNIPEGGGGGLYNCNGTIKDNTISENSAGHGGGLVRCNGTIENNMITENSAEVDGGGLGNCDAIIRNNTITGNTAGEDGGGLYFCEGVIENNTITANSAGQDGGGIYVGGAVLERNTITGNSAVRNGGGMCYGRGWLRNNVISGNSAGDEGGGLCRSGPVIENNLIVGNSADKKGGGLHDCYGTIQNNTISGNSALEGGGLHSCRAVIRNCVIWGNTARKLGKQLYQSNTPLFSCIEGGNGGTGNVREDPLFVDRDGPDDDPDTYEDNDYHLQGESPCIDAGANYYWFAWPQRDLDGGCRLVGERVDIGCYEYASTADADGDLFSDDDELAAGTYPEDEDSDWDGLRDGLELLRESDPLQFTPPRIVHVPSEISTMQEALCLAVDEDEVVVAPGTYDVNIVFCGADVTLLSSAPDNPDVVASTILDGGQRASVVTFSGEETELCMIAGFTIQNGRGDSGGGICGWTGTDSTQATVKNCVITMNWAVSIGGGVAYCDGSVQNNAIIENSSQSSGGGLGHCDGIIENNVICGNSTGGYGGGLMQCDGLIRGNLICANSAGGAGGGLRMCDGIIENNTVCHNRGTNGGGLQECNGTIRNCIIWANTAPEGPNVIYSSGPVRSWVGGDDPGFVDGDGPDDNPETYEDNDYHLLIDSPCVDAGRNEDWMWHALDMEGNPRIVDGDEDGEDGVDMGTYEYIFVMEVTGMKRTAGEGIEITWSSRPGKSYIVWSCLELEGGLWSPEATVGSDSGTTTWTDPHANSSRKFYRIGID